MSDWIIEPGTLPGAAPLRRATIVAAVRGWLGTPYQHQASLKGVGADCVGLIRGVWRECLGPGPVQLPAYGPGWSELSGQDALLETASRLLVRRPDPALVPGTIAIFRRQAQSAAKHCGIATSTDCFVHAHDGASAAEITLTPAWRRRIVAVFDFPGLVD